MTPLYSAMISRQLTTPESVSASVPVLEMALVPVDSVSV
jgi:hypothetical protein